MIDVINGVSFFKSTPSCLSYCASLSIFLPLNLSTAESSKGYVSVLHSWFISSLMCSVGGGWVGKKQEWWGEPRLLFDITTIILLAGSDLVSPWLVSIQWPVITIPEEFPLYVPLSSSLEPATAGNVMEKKKKKQTLRSADWSASFCPSVEHMMRKHKRAESRQVFSYLWLMSFQFEGLRVLHLCLIGLTGGFIL